MKTIRKLVLALGGLFGVAELLFGPIATAQAQTVPAPLLNIARTGTNQLLITVTNGVSYGNYLLFDQHVLGSSNWTLVTNPVPGVTNFVVSTQPYFQTFYQVTGSTNWNTNGIPNWAYADPMNPGLGVLTVTIVSPAQGQVIQ